MGLLGAIGAGIGAAGGAVADIGMTQMKAMIEEERQTRLAELQSEIRMRDDQTTRDRNKTEKLDEEKRLEGRAQEFANKRGEAMADSATSQVSNVTDHIDANGKKVSAAEGQGLLSEAIANAKKSGAYNQAVSAKDRADAAGDYKTSAQLDQQSTQNAQHASERGEDVDYRNKKLKAELSQMGAAQTERIEKAADKKAVKELFDKLAFDIDAAQTSGDSTKYPPQINRSIIELRKYGVDVSDMIYGKAKKTGETETEEMTPQGTQKIKKDTYAREGGVLNQPKPGVGGKPLDMKPGVNGEYVVKDGKRFFVPYK